MGNDVHPFTLWLYHWTHHWSEDGYRDPRLNEEQWVFSKNKLGIDGRPGLWEWREKTAWDGIKQDLGELYWWVSYRIKEKYGKA